VDGSQPLYTYPTGVQPQDFIFGQDRLSEGEVRLVREPLEVIQASEVGEQAVCWLTYRTANSSLR
jgi:hypothetical protein